MNPISIQSFVVNFANAFEGSVHPFTAQTRFKEIPEWNSMQALYLVGMIDSEYGVEFNSSDLKGCQTVEDVFSIVQSRFK